MVSDLNINLLVPNPMENDFFNCHSNSLNPLINQPTGKANDNTCILDHILSNQLYDAFNCIFLLDILFKIVLINCPQKRIRVKFRDHSGQNLACLKLEVEQYVNNHVKINQEVSSNTNIFYNNLFIIYIAIVVLSKKNKYILQDFSNDEFLMLLWHLSEEWHFYL